MRIPNVSERMKEAPAQALRAVFAGIGQALLISDRLRRRLRGQDEPEAAPRTTKVPVTSAKSTTSPSHVAMARPDTATPAAKPATPPVAAEPAAEAPAKPAAEAPAKPAAEAPAKPAPKTPAKPAAKAQAQPPAKGAAKTSAEPAAPRVAKPAAAKPATPAAEKPAAKPATPAAEPATPAKPAAKPPAAASGQADMPIPNYDELSVPSLRARLRILDVAQVRKMLDYEKAHASRSEVITMYERRIERLREAGG